MQHIDLASGRWHTMTLAEQMGNIGSEISRAIKAQQQNNPQRMQNALYRGLELFDLTIADPKHRSRLRELCRAREIVCDFFVGDNAYHSDATSLDKYFTAFAIAARRLSGVV